MVQLYQELDKDETESSLYQVGSPKANPCPGNWLQFSRFVEHSSPSVETLSEPEFPIPSAWPIPTGGPVFTSNGVNHAFPYASMEKYGSSPFDLPFERQYGFLPDLAETVLMNRAMGLGHNNGNYMLNVGGSVNNTGISIPRNMADNGSTNFGMKSSPMPSPVYQSKADSTKHFHIDLDKIRNSEDPRTSLMIKNIPNKYTSRTLLAAIDEHHKGTFDFLYLPIDFKNKCNVGYAFINMRSPMLIIPFYETFIGKKWEKFNSEKVIDLAYARIQGKHALVTHFLNSFQNSNLMNTDKHYLPIVFNIDGSEMLEAEWKEGKSELV